MNTYDTTTMKPRRKISPSVLTDRSHYSPFGNKRSLRSNQAFNESLCFNQSSIYKWRAEYCREYSVIRSKAKKIYNYLCNGQKQIITKQPSLIVKSPHKSVHAAAKLSAEYSLPLIKMVSNADEAIQENKNKLYELQKMKDNFTKINKQITSQKIKTYKPKSTPSIIIKKPALNPSSEKKIIKRPPISLIRALFLSEHKSVKPNSSESFICSPKKEYMPSSECLTENKTRNRGIIGKYMSQLKIDNDFMFLSGITINEVHKQ